MSHRQRRFEPCSPKRNAAFAATTTELPRDTAPAPEHDPPPADLHRQHRCELCSPKRNAAFATTTNELPCDTAPATELAQLHHHRCSLPPRPVQPSTTAQERTDEYGKLGKSSSVMGESVCDGLEEKKTLTHTHTTRLATCPRCVPSAQAPLARLTLGSAPEPTAQAALTKPYRQPSSATKDLPRRPATKPKMIHASYLYLWLYQGYNRTIRLEQLHSFNSHATV